MIEQSKTTKVLSMPKKSSTQNKMPCLKTINIGLATVPYCQNLQKWVGPAGITFDFMRDAEAYAKKLNKIMGGNSRYKKMAHI